MHRFLTASPDDGLSWVTPSGGSSEPGEGSDAPEAALSCTERAMEAGCCQTCSFSPLKFSPLLLSSSPPCARPQPGAVDQNICRASEQDRMPERMPEVILENINKHV